MAAPACASDPADLPAMGTPVPVYAACDHIPDAAERGCTGGYRNQLQLTLVLDGGGEADIAGTTIPFSPGSCLLFHHPLLCRIAYSPGTYRAMVNLRMIDGHGDDLIPDRVLPLWRHMLPDLDLLRPLLERLAELFASMDNRPLYRPRIDLGDFTPSLCPAISHLRSILYEIMHQSRRPASPAGGHVPAIRRLCQRIRHDPSAVYCASAMAATCGLSVQQFNRLFRRVAGFAPTAYVIRQRIRHATLLLTDTDLSTVAIADRLGWASASAFCAQFRQHRGMTPLAYRRRLRGAEDAAECGSRT